MAASNSAPLNSQAEKYKNIGNDFFKKGDFQQAIENYTLAIEIDSNNAAYWNNRAAAYLKDGNHEKALRDATKAIQVDPGWDKSYWRKGTVLMATSDYSAAVESFRKALDISPSTATYKRDYEDARKKLPPGELAKLEGNINFKNGRFQAALESYEKALQYAGDNDDLFVSVSNNMAACYLQQEAYNLEKVVECTSAVLERRPDDAKALLRRGQAYEAQEKFKKSLADYETVLRAYPDNTMAGSAAHRIRRAMAAYGM